MLTNQKKNKTSTTSVSRRIVQSAEKSLGITLQYKSDSALQKSLRDQGIPTLWKILKETHAHTRKI